ncbi:MAG: type II toxin-antitoxin system VapC family toxin [Chitinophagaceae bacterium]|nr:type II toxin-antitoxin system VapC family toxin [Rubrivivax sp.]
MIGIDTNVLLRLWLDDDPAQSRRIDALLGEYGQAAGGLLVSDVVLAEAVWTLGSAYSQGKVEQLKAVRSLLDEAAFAFESRDAVAAALASCERSTCDFSDCLIAAKHAALGCEFTATFDKRMRKLDGVRLV